MMVLFLTRFNRTKYGGGCGLRWQYVRTRGIREAAPHFYHPSHHTITAEHHFFLINLYTTFIMYQRLLSVATLLTLAIFTIASPINQDLAPAIEERAAILEERADGPGKPYQCNPSVVARKKFLRSIGASTRGT